MTWTTYTTLTPPPRTGETVLICMLGQTHAYPCAFDPKVGPNGTWFDHKGHAFREDRIHQWKRVRQMVSA